MKEFNEDLNTAVLTTKFVFKDSMPILFVFHHEDDGLWEFIGNQEAVEEDYIIISLEEMIKYDSSILEILELPYGGKAYRNSKESSWVKELSGTDSRQKA